MSTSASSSSLPNLVGCTIDDGRLQLIDILGRGGFGVVYLATSTNKVGSQPSYYAVKCIRWDFSEQRDLPDEIGLHKVCSYASPAVLRIHNVIEDEVRNLIYIVMDYCPDGDLLDMIASGRYAGDDELVKDVFIQILDAVEACHRSNITHRDLKPENILCKDGGKRIVLADFGLASTEKSSAQFGLGSDQFMSPEVLGGLHVELPRYSTRLADIWALGVILMNLTCCCLPWAQASLDDPGFMTYTMSDPDYLQHTFPMSAELNEILKSIFTADPRRRTSIPELRERIRSARHFGVADATATREISTAYDNGILSDDSDGSDEGNYSDDGYGGEESDLEEITLENVHIEHAVLTVRNGRSSDVENEAVVVSPTTPIGAPSSTSTAIEPLAAVLSQDVVSVARSSFANIGLDAEMDDADSDDESEGPITPEQHAVDVVVNLEDVPNFPGAGGLCADAGAPVLAGGPTLVQIFIRKGLLAEDAPMPVDAMFADALAEVTGSIQDGPPTSEMLRLAARRMGIFVRNNK